VIVLLSLLLAACTGTGTFPTGLDTSVDLSKANYEVVKQNARGESSGFKLLGIIPFSSPSYADAMDRLYDDSGVPEAGGAHALANVTKDSSSTYLILFSIPKLTVRADVIRFTD